ncbi:MAG: outer membrane receptor for ferrienterochelin and colicin [Saprospiraceae bacterium]|jgi:outer membrane receptor for ferrienterochelin and colicin
MRYLIFILFIFTALLLSGQVDSSLLEYDKLSWQHLESAQDQYLETKVISGSRSEQNLFDLPFTSHVITADEIAKNGYKTLVDALKHLPGIRVSQPGSALEGETFLMRGLQGNSYAKILINDVPIKPFVVPGMPIGAQRVYNVYNKLHKVVN